MINRHESNSFVTHATLLLQVRADGPAKEFAWQAFYDRYAPIIRGFARKLGVRTQDVSDVIQDVLLGFFVASPRFVYDPTRGRFRGYLKTCVWRIFHDRLGKEIRFGGRPLEEIDQNDIRVEAAWEDVWENEKLQRALQLVRSRYMLRLDKSRTFNAFEMYVLLEVSAEEVANELKMTVEGVHQAKSRVSKAIKVEMDKLTDD